MGNPDFKWWDDGGALLDQIICSCGWKSGTYFDGREYAHSEWKKHVKKSHAEIDTDSDTAKTEDNQDQHVKSKK